MAKRSSLSRLKGRRTTAPFLSLPSNILQSEEWAALTSFEVKMLVDLGAQYNGSNNGDLCAPWALMKARGWRSPGTLSKALRGLQAAGFIELTRQGGLHQCSLYALSWRGVDECKGKHDAKVSPVPSNTWKRQKQDRQSRGVSL
ncbi:hypothetical protein [Nevskia ramosa]|uniref:hypothetical protein n=1 Tax=Nevskia ramosa TaxID=64002 RepID=UPI0023522E6F|nr:hypothetical protein [Nevskia ramosa]